MCILTWIVAKILPPVDAKHEGVWGMWLTERRHLPALDLSSLVFPLHRMACGPALLNLKSSKQQSQTTYMGVKQWHHPSALQMPCMFTA